MRRKSSICNFERSPNSSAALLSCRPRTRLDKSIFILMRLYVSASGMVDQQGQGNRIHTAMAMGTIVDDGKEEGLSLSSWEYYHVVTM